ncbi:MAG: histidine kinase, partial [Deltaproteobacteria bacterium]|nr:histidine kinase [Deltaproteobacteria bacterium]
MSWAEISGELVLPERAARARLLARAFGLIVAGIAFFALAGWVLDVHTLKSVVPSFPAMKVNTALGLGACGAVLWLRGDGDAGPAWRKRVAVLLALAATLLAAATLSEYALGVDLRIDELLALDREVNAGAPGRPALVTALG